MSAAPIKVLVIDDEPPIRKLLRMGLSTQGYEILEASNGKVALEKLGDEPALIILDLGLPDIQGHELLRTIRARNDSVPIVVLSSRGDEAGKVQALDLGADDYLTKPFGISELLARIRVALRHSSLPADGNGQEVFQAGEVRVDLLRRQVFLGEEEAHLTPTEYKLLATLIRHAGQVMTHRLLLHEVWGANYADQTHYLRVYMAQLRHKLERDPTRPRLLITEPGVGYRLKATS
jgi:two-component system KDP operon response regulator KdpE